MVACPCACPFACLFACLCACSGVNARLSSSCKGKANISSLSLSISRSVAREEEG